MTIVQSNNRRKNRTYRRMSGSDPSAETGNSQEPGRDKVRARPWAWIIVAALVAKIGVGGFAFVAHAITSEDSNSGSIQVSASDQSYDIQECESMIMLRALAWTSEWLDDEISYLAEAALWVLDTDWWRDAERMEEHLWNGDSYSAGIILDDVIWEACPSNQANAYRP